MINDLEKYAFLSLYSFLFVREFLDNVSRFRDVECKSEWIGKIQETRFKKLQTHSTLLRSDYIPYSFQHDPASCNFFSRRCCMGKGRSGRTLIIDHRKHHFLSLTHYQNDRPITLVRWRSDGLEKTVISNLLLILHGISLLSSTSTAVRCMDEIILTNDDPAGYWSKTTETLFDHYHWRNKTIARLFDIGPSIRRIGEAVISNLLFILDGISSLFPIARCWRNYPNEWRSNKISI